MQCTDHIIAVRYVLEVLKFSYKICRGQVKSKLSFYKFNRILFLPNNNVCYGSHVK